MKFNLNGKRSSSRIQGDVRQSDLAKKSRILNGDTPGQHSDAKDTDMLDLKLNICPEDSPSVVAPPILKIPKIEPAATEDHHNKENGVDMTNFLSNAMDLSALKAPGSTKPLDLTSPRSQTHSTSSKQTDPEIITLSDSEDEFQEVSGYRVPVWVYSYVEHGVFRAPRQFLTKSTSYAIVVVNKRNMWLNACLCDILRCGTEWGS